MYLVQHTILLYKASTPRSGGKRVLMSHLFELRSIQGRIHATRWKIVSSSYIDVDIYCIVNDDIKKFTLVSTGIADEDYFIYEIKFHRTVERGKIQRMFPGCPVEAIQERCYTRIIVYYDREDNCYRPYDDPSM